MCYPAMGTVKMHVSGLQSPQISGCVKVPAYLQSLNKCPILRQMVRASQEVLCY